jgi:hypothetical protein
MLAMTTSSPAICPALPAYAELHCRSNFSFQIGASHAEELVERAHALGYSALAVTDECSVAGLVRAHGEARKRGLKLIAGAEFVLEDGAPPDEPPTPARTEPRCPPPAGASLPWRGTGAAGAQLCELHHRLPPRRAQGRTTAWAGATSPPPGWRGARSSWRRIG